MPGPSMLLKVLEGLAGVPEPLVKAAAGLVESLLGEPFKMAGSAITDQMEMWKWESRVRMAARAKEIMDQEGIAARVVPPSFLLPLVEAAGYADDPVLREMWARLLVEGVKDGKKARRIFVRTLSDLTGQDALTFMSICRETEAAGVTGPISAGDQPAWGTDPPMDPSVVTLEALKIIEWGGRGVGPDGRLLPVPSALGWLLKRAIMPRSPGPA